MEEESHWPEGEAGGGAPFFISLKCFLQAGESTAYEDGDVAWRTHDPYAEIIYFRMPLHTCGLPAKTVFGCLKKRFFQ